MARGNRFYFEVLPAPSPAVVAGTKIHQVLELMPSDVDEEWTDEDMEEANAEAQGIIDTYYGTMGREGVNQGGRENQEGSENHGDRIGGGYSAAA